MDDDKFPPAEEGRFPAADNRRSSELYTGSHQLPLAPPEPCQGQGGWCRIGVSLDANVGSALTGCQRQCPLRPAAHASTLNKVSPSLPRLARRHDCSFDSINVVNGRASSHCGTPSHRLSSA